MIGNLYSCPPRHGFGAVLGPNLGTDTSLYGLDAAGDKYACGMQMWFYPLVEAGFAILALIFAIGCTRREQYFAQMLFAWFQQMPILPTGCRVSIWPFHRGWGGLL